MTVESNLRLPLAVAAALCLPPFGVVTRLATLLVVRLVDLLGALPPESALAPALAPKLEVELAPVLEPASTDEVKVRNELVAEEL